VQCSAVQCSAVQHFSSSPPCQTVWATALRCVWCATTHHGMNVSLCEATAAAAATAMTAAQATLAASVVVTCVWAVLAMGLVAHRNTLLVRLRAPWLLAAQAVGGCVWVWGQTGAVWGVWGPRSPNACALDLVATHGVGMGTWLTALAAWLAGYINTRMVPEERVPGEADRVADRVVPRTRWAVRLVVATPAVALGTWAVHLWSHGVLATGCATAPCVLSAAARFHLLGCAGLGCLVLGVLCVAAATPTFALASNRGVAGGLAVALVLGYAAMIPATAMRPGAATAAAYVLASAILVGWFAVATAGEVVAACVVGRAATGTAVPLALLELGVSSQWLRLEFCDLGGRHPPGTTRVQLPPGVTLPLTPQSMDTRVVVSVSLRRRTTDFLERFLGMNQHNIGPGMEAVVSCVSEERFAASQQPPCKESDPDNAAFGIDEEELMDTTVQASAPVSAPAPAPAPAPLAGVAVLARGRFSMETLRGCVRSQRGMVILLGLPMVVNWALRVAGGASLEAGEVPRCRACVLLLHEISNLRAMFSHAAPPEEATVLPKDLCATLARVDALVQAYLTPRISSGRFVVPVASRDATAWLGSLTWTGRLFGRPPPFVAPPQTLSAALRPLGPGPLAQWLAAEVVTRRVGTEPATVLLPIEGASGPLLEVGLSWATQKLFDGNTTQGGAPWATTFLDNVAKVVATYLHSVLWRRLASTNALQALEAPMATLLWHMCDRLLPRDQVSARAPLLGTDPESA
jgi:hypothetical protein